MRIHPRLVLTREDLTAAVAHVGKYDEFVIDVETTFDGPKVNQVYWVGLAVPTGVFLIPMGHPLGRMTKPLTVEKRLPPDSERRVLKNGNLSEAKKEYRIPPTYADPPKQLRADVVFEALEPLLFSDRRKIGHNVKFDLESVAKYYTPLGKPEVIPPGPYGDTMLLTHVLDENLVSYGLKQLVMDWLRVPPKERADFYPNLGKIGVLEQPIDQVAWYLAKDVWYCLTYWKAHTALMDDKWPILRHALDLEHRLLGPLMRMELNGISIDTQMLDERGAQLKLDIEAVEQTCWTIAGKRFDLSNNGHKRDALFGPKSMGGQGLKPLTYTAKTGVPQINQAVLEHYAPKNEMARLLLEWSEKDKLHSTFITGMTKQLVNGKLHTSFNQHRTVTSRLSSSGPNLQQIPRGNYIRDAFWAEDGWLLVVSDYDQIELRCAAYLSNDAEMIKVFVDGLDIHAEAAASMLQKPVEEVDKEERQVGKAQPNHSLVLTPKGWVRIDSLVVGDEVIDPVTGGPVMVQGVFPQGQRPTYKVSFSDGAVVECDEEHLWKVNAEVKPLSDIIPRIRKGEEYRYSVPMTKPVQLPRQELAVPPYVMGVLLGDGNITGPSVLFASVDDEVVERVREELPGYQVKHHGGCSYSITQGAHKGTRGAHATTMQAKLRVEGVMGKRAWEKSVPEKYLHSSVADRIAVLQGLLDTDGFAGGGYIEFCSSSPQLASDVQTLVRSLGGTAKISKGTTTHRDRYRVHIALPHQVQPFHLSRKNAGYTRTRAVKRKITGVEYLGMQECRCISVDSADHLYITNDFVVTHNTQNFLTLYGGGPDKLARVAKTDKDTAIGFIERYYQRFSGLNAWKHDEVYKAKERGVRGSRVKVPYAEIPPFHRRRRVPDLYSGDHFERSRAERQVVNSIVQGFAASIMKLALIDLDAELYESEKLLLNVHDEVIVTAPEGYIDQTRNRVVRIMEGVQYEGMPILGEVPLTADAKVARRWSEGK